MTEEIKRLTRTGGIYLLGNIANRIGAFLLLPLYTHRLSVQEYGLLELLYSTMAMISVLISLGLSHATLRFYFEYQKKKDRDAVITTNFTVTLILATVVMLILSFWRTSFASLVLGDPRLASVLTICFVIIVLEMTAEILLAYLRAREFAFLFVALAILQLVVQVSGSLFFLIVRGEGVPGVLKANLICVGVSWIVALLVVLRNCGFSVHREKILPILRYSLPFALGGIIGVASGNIDRFMVNKLVSMEAVGIYGLAARFTSLLSFLLAEPFSRSYGPFRFSIIRNSNAASIQSLVARYLVIGTTFLSLGIALYTPDVIRIMATKEYLGAASLVPILLFGAGFAILNYCFQTGILYSKETKHLFRISLGSAVFGVLVNYFLLSAIGIMGAAISFTLTQILVAMWTNWKSQRFFRVEYPLSRMIWIVSIGVCMYILGAFFQPDNVVVSVFWKLLLCCIFLVIGYFTDNDVKGVLNWARLRLVAQRAQ
jgi:O-antigen/teichoic acid export membrane protein